MGDVCVRNTETFSRAKQVYSWRKVMGGKGRWQTGRQNIIYEHLYRALPGLKVGGMGGGVADRTAYEA